MPDPHFDADARQRELASEARGAATEAFSDLWWVFLVRGVLALALGIAALFWPSGSISLLIRIAGLFLVLDGAMTFFGTRRRAGHRGAGASGVGAMIIGAVLLLLPTLSVRFVFILLGVWALIVGGGYLATWWQMPSGVPEKSAARNVGLVALLAGIILIVWPGTGVVALGWFIAIIALVVAVMMFFLASRFRRLRSRLS